MTGNIRVYNDKTLTILDVRTEAEYGPSRIPEAQPYDYLRTQETTERLAKLDRAKPYVLYCAIGGRAELVAQRAHVRVQRLLELGIDHAVIPSLGATAARSLGTARTAFWPTRLRIQPLGQLAGQFAQRPGFGFDGVLVVRLGRGAQIADCRFDG